MYCIRFISQNLTFGGVGDSSPHPLSPITTQPPPPFPLLLPQSQPTISPVSLSFHVPCLLCPPIQSSLSPSLVLVLFRVSLKNVASKSFCFLPKSIFPLSLPGLPSSHSYSPLLLPHFKSRLLSSPFTILSLSPFLLSYLSVSIPLFLPPSLFLCSFSYAPFYLFSCLYPPPPPFSYLFSLSLVSCVSVLFCSLSLESHVACVHPCHRKSQKTQKLLGGYLKKSKNHHKNKQGTPVSRVSHLLCL
jgi:hypothetical protein